MTYYNGPDNYRQHIQPVYNSDLTSGKLELDVRNMFVPPTSESPENSSIFLRLCTKRGTGDCFCFRNWDNGYQIQTEYFGAAQPQFELGFGLPAGRRDVLYCYLPQSGFSDACPGPGH